MSDRYNQDLILGYVEGELDDAQRGAFETTLADDHELRTLVSQMKLDRERLRSLGRSTAPIGLIDQVIQTQERAELLGDPEAPEPLPLPLPVNRHRLRRVLVYSGIAAVLLLSAAVVVPTLMPSGLLDHNSPLASNLTDTTSGKSPKPDKTYARVDEDAAYDRLADKAPAAAADAAGEPDLLDAGTSLAEVPTATVTQPDPASAGSAKAPADGMAVAEPVADKLREAETEVAMAEPVDVSTGTEAADPADAATTVATNTPLLAEADQADQPAATPTVAAVRDPFGGYDSDAPSAIGRDTQLLVNAASPMQVRRQLRDWALDNSVRVIEEPTARSLRNRALAAGGAGEPVTDTRLIIEIRQEQVPALLVYLNQDPGQRAELVTLDTKEQQPDAKRQALAARDAAPKPDDQPKALANQYVTRNNWPGQVGLAQALTTQDAPSAPNADQSEQEPDTTDSQAEKTGSEADNTDTKSQADQSFDWSHLLDNITLQPLNKPSPLLQPASSPRLRLQVLIRQAATDTSAEETH